MLQGAGEWNLLRCIYVVVVGSVGDGDGVIGVSSVGTVCSIGVVDVGSVGVSTFGVCSSGCVVVGCIVGSVDSVGSVVGSVGCVWRPGSGDSQQLL